MLLFTLESDDILFSLNEIDKFLNHISSPSLEIVSKLTNLRNLSDYDIHKNLNPKINPEYYSMQQLSSLETTEKDLTFLHMNIRSLSLHFEELHALLASKS